jgi:hypothetical protein
LATCRVEVAGIGFEIDSAWVMYCGRSAYRYGRGGLVDKGFVLHDRDPVFNEAFCETLLTAGVRAGRPPPCSPNLGTHIKHCGRSIKESRLNPMIVFGDRSIRRAIRDFRRTQQLCAQSPRTGQPIPHLRRCATTTQKGNRV